MVGLTFLACIPVGSDLQPAASHHVQWPRLCTPPESRRWWAASRSPQRYWCPAPHKGLSGELRWQLSLLQEVRATWRSLMDKDVKSRSCVADHHVFLWSNCYLERCSAELRDWRRTFFSRQRRRLRTVPSRGGGTDRAQQVDARITEGTLHSGDHTLQPNHTWRRGNYVSLMWASSLHEHLNK